MSALEDRRQLEARLYAELGSLEAVAKLVGVSPQIVSRDLDKLGVEKRSAGQPAKYPPPEERRCAHCGGPFTPKSPAAAARGQRFCSKACVDEAKAKHPKAEPRPCVVCGEMFTPRLRRAGPTARTCSTAHEKIAKAKYPQPEPRTCAYSLCTKVFTPEHPSAAVNGEGFYCTTSHAALARWDSGRFDPAILKHANGRTRQVKLGARAGKRAGRAAGRRRGYTDLQARGVVALRQEEPDIGIRRLADRTGLSEWQVRSIIKDFRKG